MNAKKHGIGNRSTGNQSTGSRSMNRRSLAVRCAGYCLRMLILLLAVSAASFFLLDISPLDPLTTNVGQSALGSMSEEQIARLNEYWGVGIPASQRFFSWLSGILRGEFGISLLYRRPVLEIIGEKALNSFWLMGTAWLCSGILGAALGMIAGVKRGRWQDKLITAYCMVMAGTPAFWLALVLLLVFAVHLGVFPIGFSVPVGMAAAEVTVADRISHAFLPALALGLTGVSNIAMHTRSKMIRIMESDYILYARARGERGWRLVWRHGFRSILLPVITLQFASVSEIFGGSVLVEQVFSYPGLGNAAVAAGLGSDVPLLLGVTLVSAVIVFLGNTTADLLYYVVDPQMRREMRAARRPKVQERKHHRAGGRKGDAS